MRDEASPPPENRLDRNQLGTRRKRNIFNAPPGPKDELFERAEVRSSALVSQFQLVGIYCQAGMVGSVVAHNAETAQKLCELLNQHGPGKTMDQICAFDVDTDLTILTGGR